MFLKWTLTIGTCFYVWVLFGFDYLNFAPAVIIVYLLFVFRFLQRVYNDYKFILFSIELNLDIDLDKEEFSDPKHNSFKILEARLMKRERLASELAEPPKSFTEKVKESFVNTYTVITYYIKIEPMMFTIKMTALLALSILLTKFFEGICIERNKSYPYPALPLPLDISFSTRAFYLFSTDPICKPGAPCHVYVTLPQ
mmetsp:Transcript_20398/g.19377  ORF Transcript_20398/g.19377 Transcript_20398/m.19377 type:complete len:198 (+) Transcript_20398:130-723(+)